MVGAATPPGPASKEAHQTRIGGPVVSSGVFSRKRAGWAPSRHWIWPARNLPKVKGRGEGGYFTLTFLNFFSAEGSFLGALISKTPSLSSASAMSGNISSGRGTRRYQELEALSRW